MSIEEKWEDVIVKSFNSDESISDDIAEIISLKAKEIYASWQGQSGEDNEVVTEGEDE